MTRPDPDALLGVLDTLRTILGTEELADVHAVLQTDTRTGNRSVIGLFPDWETAQAGIDRLRESWARDHDSTMAKFHALPFRVPEADFSTRPGALTEHDQADAGRNTSGGLSGGVRLTVTFGRVKGLRNRPNSARRGGRVKEEFPDWEIAVDRMVELLEEAEDHGWPVLAATVMDVAVARKSEMAAQQGQVTARQV